MKQLWAPAQLATFAHVVDLNSFSAAAQALRVPKAAVSRAISELETELGTKLLERTTRRIRLTTAGEILYPYCRRIAAETAAVVGLAAGWRSHTTGPLRVRADPAFGRALLAPLVPRFLEKFPDMPLDVELATVAAPEATRDADVIVCIGETVPMGHAQKALGSPPAVLCATPAYLQKRGSPQRPEDLHQHDLLVPASTAAGFELSLSQATRRAQLSLVPKLAVNDPGVLHSATVAGLGVGLLPEFLCRQGLATRKLEAVLPDWTLPELAPLRAIFRADMAQDRRVVALLEFLTANIVPVLAGR
jgi:DNA-binding transcriptional LysR family regulator